MPFTKGQSGNLAGRPKGSKNKVTAEARALFNDILSGEIGNIQQSLEALREESHEKYMKALNGLLPYFLPKQQDIELTVNEEPKAPSWFTDIDTANVDHSWMTDED